MPSPIRLQRSPLTTFPGCDSLVVLNIIHIQAFKVTADLWAQLRVTRSQGKRATHRGKCTEGRKETVQQLRRERRDGRRKRTDEHLL